MRCTATVLPATGKSASVIRVPSCIFESLVCQIAQGLFPQAQFLATFPHIFSFPAVNVAGTC